MTWKITGVHVAILTRQKFPDDKVENLWKEIDSRRPNLFFNPEDPKPNPYPGFVLARTQDAFTLNLGVKADRVDLWINPKPQKLSPETQEHPPHIKLSEIQTFWETAQKLIQSLDNYGCGIAGIGVVPSFVTPIGTDSEIKNKILAALNLEDTKLSDARDLFIRFNRPEEIKEIKLNFISQAQVSVRNQWNFQMNLGISPQSAPFKMSQQYFGTLSLDLNTLSTPLPEFTSDETKTLFNKMIARLKNCFNSLVH